MYVLYCQCNTNSVSSVSAIGLSSWCHTSVYSVAQPTTMGVQCAHSVVIFAQICTYVPNNSGEFQSFSFKGSVYKAVIVYVHVFRIVGYLFRGAGYTDIIFRVMGYTVKKYSVLWHAL